VRHRGAHDHVQQHGALAAQHLHEGVGVGIGPAAQRGASTRVSNVKQYTLTARRIAADAPRDISDGELRKGVKRLHSRQR
jgi:hypothetical protein